MEPAIERNRRAISFSRSCHYLKTRIQKATHSCRLDSSATGWQAPRRFDVLVVILVELTRCYDCSARTMVE